MTIDWRPFNSIAQILRVEVPTPNIDIEIAFNSIVQIPVDEEEIRVWLGELKLSILLFRSSEETGAEPLEEGQAFNSIVQIPGQPVQARPGGPASRGRSFQFYCLDPSAQQRRGGHSCPFSYSFNSIVQIHTEKSVTLSATINVQNFQFYCLDPSGVWHGSY